MSKLKEDLTELGKILLIPIGAFIICLILSALGILEW
jgi:hypothetical protein